MKIAKRTLFVDRNQLRKLLGLPEEIEIMGVRPGRFGEGWELLLASAGEVSMGETKLTITSDYAVGEIRRISLDTLLNSNNEKEVD